MREVNRNYLFLSFLLIHFIISCSNSENHRASDKVTSITVSKNCLVKQNKMTGILSFKLLSNDTTLLKRELIDAIKDTTITEIDDCYISEELSVGKLTKGQISFWVFTQIHPISYIEVLESQIHTWGRNHRDTSFSNCQYPMYLMELVNNDRNKIHEKLLNLVSN